MKVVPKEEVKPEAAPAAEMTQEQVLAHNKKIVDDFLADPKHREDAVASANQFMGIYRDEWFTAKQLTTKFKVKREDAELKLATLVAFQMAAKKEERGVNWYRIDLSHKIQRRLYSQAMEFHEAQVLIFKEKLSKLD